MLNCVLEINPEWATENLLLSRLRDEDIPVLHRLRCDERVNRFIDRPKNPSLEDVQAWMNKTRSFIENRQSFYWTIQHHGMPDLIGTICLFHLSDEDDSAEVGFELFPEHQGKGLMREALRSVLNFSSEILLTKRIDAWIHRENTASMKLAQHFGFSRNAILEEKYQELPELQFLQIFSRS